MNKMNDFDEALRQAIEKQVSNQHVVFIQKDFDNQKLPRSSHISGYYPLACKLIPKLGQRDRSTE